MTYCHNMSDTDTYYCYLSGKCQNRQKCTYEVWWLQRRYLIYLMVPFSMTLSDLWPGFQGHNFFEVEYLKRIMGQSFYRTLIGNHTQSVKWYHFQWPEWPLTWISTSQHFWSRISEKQCILKTKLLLHSNRNYTWHMEWCYVWWPWLTSIGVAWLCQHQLSFLFFLVITHNEINVMKTSALMNWLCVVSIDH